ncbi:MAG: hypothetical protein Q7K42_02455, partial [Candidatus Diapherotrites archaeon]|nr:hypothetical protein [Candidatus Diapherotrites archaeon]
VVIDATIKISEFLNISQLAIGFIVVAVAVSMPDFVVAVTASLQGSPALGIGDALGSSIANICLVLGIATFIRKIDVERTHTLESAELLLMISVIPLIILSKAIVGTFEGIILLLVFVLYCLFVLKSKFSLKIKDGIKKSEFVKLLILFAIGMVIVVFSARMVVDSAVDLARFLKINEAIIGLVVLSFGTTLPELAIDFTAIRKGQIALAIGDVLGSTVTNLTLILGTVLIISPTVIDIAIYSVPLAFIVIANSFLVYNLYKHQRLGRAQGIAFLGLYILFIGTTIFSSLPKPI